MKNYEVTSEQITKDRQLAEYNKGFNPFTERRDHIETKNFSLESILFVLDMLPERKHKDLYRIKDIEIQECNVNPYIYLGNGEKKYYQRDFCWTIEQSQLLIESIYQNIDCGKILVRKRGWKELEHLAKQGETELAFHDLIDGKQRLTSVILFINDAFPDLGGNYFSSFSKKAKHILLNGEQLFSYAILPENSIDQDVLRQFLKLNHTGTPQSPDHIAFVKDLYYRCNIEG